MTDTQPTTNPPSPADMVKVFIGDLARPLAIILLSLSAAAFIGCVSAAVVLGKPVSLVEAAAFIGAILTGLGGIYYSKSHENVRVAQAQAGG